MIEFYESNKNRYKLHLAGVICSSIAFLTMLIFLILHSLKVITFWNSSKDAAIPAVLSFIVFIVMARFIVLLIGTDKSYYISISEEEVKMRSNNVEYEFSIEDIKRYYLANKYLISIETINQNYEITSRNSKKIIDILNKHINREIPDEDKK